MLKRSRERTNSPCVPHLAPHGVYSELLSPIFRVSSYLTFSPLPFKGLYISVALFLRLPWLDVIKRDCSVVLGLSSLQAARLSNQREYYTTFYNFSQHQFLISFCYSLIFCLIVCSAFFSILEM